MSWPTKDDLYALLQSAKGQPGYTLMAVRAEHLVYLIENLDRLTGEVAALADRVDELHESYNKQLRRAKKWKRKYTALATREQPHE